MTDTKPTLPELIEHQQSLCENYQPNPVVYIIAKEILASLKELAAIKSQPVPVEPDAIAQIRKITDPTYFQEVALGYIDSLQSALKVAQQERDEHGKEWARSAEALVITVQRAEKAEASNKRMVDALQPFAFFAEQWNKNPINRLHDTLYSIHSGDDAAEFRLSDCQKAAELLREVGK